MNKIETIVYNLVRKNPALKIAIRNVYQSIFDILPHQKNYFDEEIDLREEYFFGFHDVSPFSNDDTKILACHNHFDLRMPIPEESLEIGYFDLINGKFAYWHRLDESLSWNYHKGCRLQWLDKENIIFNTAVNGRLVAKIINIINQKETIVPIPIDAVFISDQEKIATSFSYGRLERCMPGYGYPYTDGGLINDCHPKETGLFLANLTLGTKELIINLEELSLSLPEDLRNGSIHFVTHTEFSKDGRYISFLYRRIPVDDNFLKRWTQIRVYDRKTKRVIVLPTQDSGSHYVWNNKNQIIASCFMDGKNCHVLFDMNDVDNQKVIAQNVLNSDGHQSFISDDRFVTDTYPDNRRMARIFEVNIISEETKQLVRVFSPKEFQTRNYDCHIACDLHPRVSNSGKYLCFDSPVTGKRALYVMKIT